MEGGREARRGNVHDHLLPTQQSVADEFARPQRDGLLAVCHAALLNYPISQ